MTKIRIGGVPEHFNMPWQYAIEKNLFQENGIDLNWTDFPGGTGAMNKALRDSDLDVAVVLTEGIVADIVRGNACKIVQWYVKSPLIWGIHVALNSTIISADDFPGKKYAISRLGSGSHLMAYVDANQRGTPISEEQFVVVDNIDGAVNSLVAGASDLFMWEKFMTKPFVDKGILRRVGECPTPWPSFVIAVREEYLYENQAVIEDMLSTIQNACTAFYTLTDVEDRIVKRFNLLPNDVHEWFKAIQWQTNNSFDPKELEGVVSELFSLKIIDRKVSLSAICSL